MLLSVYMCIHCSCCRSYADEVDREQAGTPTMESEGFEFLNESAMSGYDGDKEDEDDSFLDQEGKFTCLS